MSSQVIYVESCPVCGDGLCRIRICIHNQRMTGIVLCEECEAIWTDPAMRARVLATSDDDTPRCPDCDQSVWSGNSHWANVGEVCLLGWFDRVHIVPE